VFEQLPKRADSYRLAVPNKTPDDGRTRSGKPKMAKKSEGRNMDDLKQEVSMVSINLSYFLLTLN